MTPDDPAVAVTLAEYALLGDIYAAIVDASDDPACVSSGGMMSTRNIDHALGVTLERREDGSDAGDLYYGEDYSSAEDEGPQRRRTDRVEARHGCG